MSERCDGNQAAAPADKSPRLLRFEERLAHFATGYNNSQSVVRLLDTKAAAVIGVVPVLVGVLSAVFAWLRQSWDWEVVVDMAGPSAPIALSVALLLVALASLVFAWLTLIAAFDAISPKHTGDARPSLLFPFEPPEPASTGAGSQMGTFASRVSLFAGTPSQDDAIEDYQRQIVRMSQIVAQKLSHVSRAVAHLKRVFLLSVLALVLMVLAVATSTVPTDHLYSEQRDGAPAVALTDTVSSMRSVDELRE